MIRLVALALVLAVGSSAAGPEPEPPESGIVEHARASLALIDITVSGPPNVITSLGPEDFRIKVNFQRIEDFTLDRHCVEGAGEAPGDGRGAKNDEPIAMALPVRYVLYFDQRQLTLAGRQRSLDLARQLVPSLVGSGNEAMIVSSAERIEVIEKFTESAEALDAALGRLEHHRDQWDMWSTHEAERLGSVVELLNEGGGDVTRAIAEARRFHREERLRTDRDLRRLAVTLAWLGDIVQPKIVLYFADTVRSNAGEHYLSFFGRDLWRPHPTLSSMAMDSFSGGLSFDAVVNEAASQGVRFYPVLGLGLATISEHARPSQFGVQAAQTQPDSPWVRMRDVEGTLDDLAAETGGKAFFHGESAAAIARKIRSDFSCLYVASFDPSRFDEDAPLRVVVESEIPGVRLTTRGRLVVRSEEATRTARLLGAFSLSTDEGESVVRPALVPTGYRDGRYTALLQVSVPGSAIPRTSWDIGVSVVMDAEVVAETSSRIVVSRAGLPLVLEQEVRLEPGAYELVAVAHEQASDFIFSEQAGYEWPDPDRSPASLLPVAILQPVHGAFVREGSERTHGSLDHAPSAIDGTLPTAFVGLVCRGRKHRASLVVERVLVGSSSVEFPSVTFDLDDERCAQLRDVVPASLLEPGSYRYEVRVLEDGRTLSSIGREVVVRGG